MLMSQSKENLEYMGRKLQEEYSKWGFTMNIAKTKYMSVGTDTNHLDLDNGDIITGCTEFRHLRTIFAEDGRDTKNIRHRVAQHTTLQYNQSSDKFPLFTSHHQTLKK